jgi:hypothetical protein
MDGARKARTNRLDRPEATGLGGFDLADSRQKFTPAACQGRGGTGVYTANVVQAGKNFKGL